MLVELLCLGAVALDGTWKYKDLISPFWRLYGNKRAGARIRADGSWIPLHPGRLYLIPAFTSYATEPVAGVEHVYVHFTLHGPPSPVLRALFPRPLALAHQPQRSDRLFACGDAIAQGRPPDTPLLLTVRAIIDECLAEIVAQLPEDARAQLASPAPRQPGLAKVLAHIDSAANADCRLPVLARLAGCTCDHLTRLFRRYLKQTPVQYVAERRLTAAALRLSSSDEDLESVAVAHGFANRYSFTRAFTRHLGVPPARWRRNRIVGVGQGRTANLL